MRAAVAVVLFFKYVPKPPTDAMCNASFTSAPGTPTFVGQRNLCCR